MDVASHGLGNVQAAAASAVAGDDAEQQGDQTEGEPVRKRARGRPLGSKTKVAPAPTASCTPMIST